MFYEFCHNGPVSDSTLRRYCTMPTTTGWLSDIGALSWFESRGYSVSRDTMEVPVFYLPIHSKVDAGEHDVYDISVDRLESFVANGIVVHNCKFLRDTYTKILDMIMDKGGLDDAICILVDAIQDLLDGRVPYEDLIIIRELGANYKSESYFMKVFSDDLKKAGKIVNPGDRLDFVIVEDPTATLLGHKMKLSEQYLERLNTPNPERIDYNYYIEKVLMNPINQLFEVGFKDIIAQLQHVSYRPTNRHKTIYLDRPVQIILKMRERGYDLMKFKEAVQYNVMKLKGVNRLVLNVVDPKVIIPQVPIPQANISLTLNVISPTTPTIPHMVNGPITPTIPHMVNGPITPTTPQIVKGPTPTIPQIVKAPTTPTLITPRFGLRSSMNNNATSPAVRPITLNITTPRIQAIPIMAQGLNLPPTL